jgi:gliding motility-associated protein GldL
MAKKKGFLDSRAFKIFMKYLYGLGAAVVIGGALFKIMHWPFANQMLIAGMGTEVLVFFVSAFEPLHEELDWGRVYPQLAEDADEDFIKMDGSEGDEFSVDDALAIADQGMRDVEITPELFQNLSGSLISLKDNVNKLSDLQDATVATNEYTQNVKNASNSMGQLNENYSHTVEAMSSLAQNVGGASADAKAYQEQVQQVTKNLSSLNAVYEIELQDAQSHIKSLNSFYESLSGAMSNMMDASKDAESYRQEVGKLTQNLRDLNGIYGGMLSAMGRGSSQG